MEGWRLACVDIFRFIDSVTHMYLFSIGLLLKLIFGKPGEPTECCRTCSRQAKYLKHIFGHFLPDTWSFWTKIGQIYGSCYVSVLYLKTFSFVIFLRLKSTDKVLYDNACGSCFLTLLAEQKLADAECLRLW